MIPWIANKRLNASGQNWVTNNSRRLGDSDNDVGQHVGCNGEIKECFRSSMHFCIIFSTLEPTPLLGALFTETIVSW